MRRFNRVSALLGVWMLLALGGCAVYVVPAEEAGSGAEDESAAVGTGEPEGIEARGEGAERPDEPTDGSPTVVGVERRRGDGSVGAAVPTADVERRRTARRRARAGARQLHVPPGHHPPAGQCRVWYEGRPPGRQPAPAPCDQLLANRYPVGVFILYDGESWDGNYDWEAAALEFPGAVPRPVIALSARIGGDAGSAPGAEVASSDTPSARGASGAASGVAGGAAGSGNSDASGPRDVRIPARYRPPDGLCRVWYEGTPPGRQEPSRPCDELADRELESGAFILYGDGAYDVDHDWTAAEARESGAVPAALVDVLVRSPEPTSGAVDVEEAHGEEEVSSESGAASGASEPSDGDSTAGGDGGVSAGTRTPVVDLPGAGASGSREPRR